MRVIYGEIGAEGIPTIDKASMQCKDYALFRDRLAEMGLACGVLVQCTIGHGYALNQPSAFQPYVNLSDGKADVVLAETDTCPQNRYSTGAQSLHSHFVASVLEGAKGAKHWITRLATFEPQSGKAFRKILAKNRGLYDTLAAMVPTMQWVGCRIPLPVTPDYGLTVPGWYSLSDAWSSCVLERFGVPLYFSSKNGGAVFLEGNAVNAFTDKEIEEMLGGTVFLAADAIEKLESRGFAKDMGVTVRPWKGARASFERLYVNGNKANAQKWIRELVVTDERAQVASMTMHLKDGKDEIPLFPAVTVFHNDRGGTVIAFCGSPNTEFNYLQAFAFLTASRKLQMVELLKNSGNLPVYYPDDSEVYLKAAYLPDGGLFTAVFNISLDPLEEVPLVTEKSVCRVEMLTADGNRVPCPFRKEGDGIVIEKR